MPLESPTISFSLLLIAEAGVPLDPLRNRLQALPGWSVRLQTASGQEALQTLRQSRYDLAVLSYPFGGIGGFELLDRIRQLHPKTPVVLLAEPGNERFAVPAIRKGALDFIFREDVPQTDLADLLWRAHQARYLAEHSLELRQLDEMKTEFIANISHEVRTPLSVVIGYADMLRSRSLGPLTEAQGKAVESIIARSEDLLATLNRILDVRSIVERRQSLLLKATGLRELLSELARQPHRELDRKKISLSLRLPAEEVWVRADREKLCEVLDNLFSNAAKFGPSDSEVRLSLEARGGEALVSVADSGPGVSERALARVFERFSAAGHGTTREHPGLGLGLPLSKQIIEQHAGRIWLESKPGAGCRACFAIPLASKDSPDIEVKLPARYAKKRVLIVEDNPDSLEVLQVFLSGLSRNLELSAASTGIEALESIKNHKPNLIILDAVMPGMDGFEVIERLRLLPETERIPVIVLTGHSVAAEKARAIGVSDVLLKPFETRDLLDKVLRLLQD